VGSITLCDPTESSARRSQAEVVAQERNVVVFAEKPEHLWHRVKRLPQVCPEGDDFGNGAFNQLSDGVLEGVYPRSQSTPGSFEATGLYDPGRRVQTLSLDPRPPVEIPLQPLSSNRPIGQSMRWQHREAQAARTTEIALYAFFFCAFRISEALVSSMAVDCPRTCARTRRTESSELIFSKLDGGTSPKSSPAIKPLSFGLHGASVLPLLTNVAGPRYPINLQRYTRVGP
jgi:hypothetical protein